MPEPQPPRPDRKQCQGCPRQIKFDSTIVLCGNCTTTARRIRRKLGSIALAAVKMNQDKRLIKLIMFARHGVFEQ